MSLSNRLELIAAAQLDLVVETAGDETERGLVGPRPLSALCDCRLLTSCGRFSHWPTLLSGARAVLSTRRRALQSKARQGEEIQASRRGRPRGSVMARFEATLEKVSSRDTLDPGIYLRQP